MTSLILEGGTFRPIFTAGVLDALLEYHIEMPYVIGVSAGITNGLSYASKQKGRNLEVLLTYRQDPRYISRKNFIKEHSLFGLKFAFEDIPNELIPFDIKTFNQYPGRFLVGVTNIKTGQAEYIEGKHNEQINHLIQATCSIPFVFPPCQLGDQIYYDGGISDPIPIKKAMEDGNTKHLIILTQPDGYQKQASKSHEFMARSLQKRYPMLAQQIRTRHIRYNETLDFIHQLKREGKALIIQPTHPLNSFEDNLEILEKTYQEGYSFTKRNIELIKQFIQE